jgi:hypothetical protein
MLATCSDVIVTGAFHGAVAHRESIDDRQA